MIVVIQVIIKRFIKSQNCYKNSSGIDINVLYLTRSTKQDQSIKKKKAVQREIS